MPASLTQHAHSGLGGNDFPQTGSGVAGASSGAGWVRLSQGGQGSRVPLWLGKLFPSRSRWKLCSRWELGSPVQERSFLLVRVLTGWVRPRQCAVPMSQWLEASRTRRSFVIRSTMLIRGGGRNPLNRGGHLAGPGSGGDSATARNLALWSHEGRCCVKRKREAQSLELQGLGPSWRVFVRS